MWRVWQETYTSETSRLQTGESGWQAEINTDNTSAGRLSQASSVPTYSNKWVRATCVTS